MSMEYIRRAYNVPAKRGALVTFQGKPGVITGSRGAYLRIRLDGEKRAGIYHPTWEIEYIASDGEQPRDGGEGASMYFEEKLIDGWWYFRGTPDGDWRRMTAEQLNSRLTDYRREVEKLRVEVARLERVNEVQRTVIQDVY